LNFSRVSYLGGYFEERPKTTHFLKQNGQFVAKPKKAKITDSSNYSIERLAVQTSYFEKILNFCKTKGIQVFIVMPPTRKSALANFKPEQMIEFDDFIVSHTNKNIHFLNFTNTPGYTIDDFTDITHLNELAANRFTRELNTKIVSLLRNSK
jgi:hypothetical protein